MTEHTPTPWAIGRDANILEADGTQVATFKRMGDAGSIVLTDAAPHECSDPRCPGRLNQRTLDAASKMADFLATWESCLAGLQMTQEDFDLTSGLRDYNAAIATGKGKTDTLLAQRDRLLEACEALLEHGAFYGTSLAMRARAAIAKAKGTECHPNETG